MEDLLSVGYLPPMVLRIIPLLALVFSLSVPTLANPVRLKSCTTQAPLV